MNIYLTYHNISHQIQEVFVRATQPAELLPWCNILGSVQNCYQSLCNATADTKYMLQYLKHHFPQPHYYLLLLMTSPCSRHRRRCTCQNNTSVNQIAETPPFIYDCSCIPNPKHVHLKNTRRQQHLQTLAVHHRLNNFQILSSLK